MRTLLRTLSLAFVILFLAALTAAKWWGITPIADLVQAAPALDDADCVALAERIDQLHTARQKPTAEQQQAYDQCVLTRGCDRSQQAEPPEEAYKSSTATLRFVMQECAKK